MEPATLAMQGPTDGGTPAHSYLLNRLEPFLSRLEGLDPAHLEVLLDIYLAGLEDANLPLHVLLRQDPI